MSAEAAFGDVTAPEPVGDPLVVEAAEDAVRAPPSAVLQSGDAYENRMRVLPLAIALRDHGWEPIVLVDDLGAASAFLVHGLACVSVAALADAARADDGRPDDGPEFDPDDLCALSLRRRAISRRGIGDAEWRTIEAQTRLIWRMLDALAPDAILVWNGYTGVWANALRSYKAARGLPGGFMERGPMAGAAFVDRRGVNGHASLAPGGRKPRPGEPQTRFADLPAALRPADLEARGRNLPRKNVIFVPLQVQDDSNILLHSPRILRMRDLANVAIRLAERLGRDWRVVLRPHPEEAADARLNLPLHTRVTIDAEKSLDHYLNRAAVCLTVNSNVGLLASLRGAVTVCLGEGIYCRRPFVLEGQHGDLGRLVGEVKARLAQPPAVRKARAFLDELASRSLFWPGQDQALASAKLAACGLKRAKPAEKPDGSEWRSGVRVERGGAGFARAAEAIAALRREPGEIVADFDFAPGETQFLTYRANREPLTRNSLEARAAATLGRPLRLADAHRALGRQGRVLIGHSRRMLEDTESYDLVLDEFGLPHARTYLETAAQP